jgi:hypothetical protein
MRVFAIKRFYKWAKSNDLSDGLLSSAVVEIEKAALQQLGRSYLDLSESELIPRLKLV